MHIYSCVNSTKTIDPIVKVEPVVTTFIPDRFEFLDDTASLNIDKGKLFGKILTLDLSFMAIPCIYAQWAETKYLTNPDKRIDVFLKPPNISLINADTLFDGRHLPVRITARGQFYSGEGYPKSYRPLKGYPKLAKVFRYTKNKIISLGSGLNAKLQ